MVVKLAYMGLRTKVMREVRALATAIENHRQRAGLHYTAALCVTYVTAATVIGTDRNYPKLRNSFCFSRI